MDQIVKRFGYLSFVSYKFMIRGFYYYKRGGEDGVHKKNTLIYIDVPPVTKMQIVFMI